jgi:glycerophosphoryl diester phosphodiesterase
MHSPQAGDPTWTDDSAVLPFPRPFQIIAHRGASAYAPENTIPAFRMARELGAFEVELDAQLSRDDIVVLYHDDELETKTGQPGSVRDYVAQELLEFEIGSWFDRTHPDVELRFAGTRLNTLEQLFEVFGPALYYHVELKSADPGLPRRTLETIDEAGLRDRVRITSFDLEQLKRSHALAPGLPHTLLIRDAKILRAELAAGQASLSTLQQRKIDIASQAGFDQVGIAAEDLDRDVVAYARSRGLFVRAWRIRGDADMQRAIEMGAAGMTTNWPDRLIRRLVEHMGSSGQ